MEKSVFFILECVRRRVFEARVYDLESCCGKALRDTVLRRLNDRSSKSGCRRRGRGVRCARRGGSETRRLRTHRGEHVALGRPFSVRGRALRHGRLRGESPAAIPPHRRRGGAVRVARGRPQGRPRIRVARYALSVSNGGIRGSSRTLYRSFPKSETGKISRPSILSSFKYEKQVETESRRQASTS